MSKNLENILQPTECISPEEIKNYLDDNLTKDDRFKIEKHLNECEFCNDAIEGFELVDSEFVILDTQELNSKIDKKFNRGFNIQYIIAAASISVVLFFGALYIITDSAQKDEISIQSESFEEKLTEDVLAPKVIESEDNSDLEETEIEEENTVIKVTQPSNSIKKETKPENQVENTFTPSKSEIFEDVEIVVESSSDEMDDLSFANNENSKAIEQEAGSVAMEPATRSYSVSDSEIEVQKIDFNSMIALAKENIIVESQEVVITETKTTSSKKKETASYGSEAHSNNSINNSSDLENLLVQVEAEQYQQVIDKVDFQLKQDIWSNEESTSLRWLKVICELKLEKSAKQTLKVLKSYKNPYQEASEKLFNELY